MKKTIRLTESELIKLIERVVQEGKTEKGVKSKDSDLKIDTFQNTVKDYLKSMDDVTVKKVGDDFEVHLDGDHVGQVMFRKDKITVKKVGNKFGKDFDYNELGKVKRELKRVFDKD